MNSPASMQTILATSLAEPTVVKSISYFLDWCPELKHEGLVSTHISAYLRSTGVQSRREQSLSRRRIDIVIAGSAIESKYHFEGDLLEIEEALSAGAAYSAGAWNSATNAVLSELKRGKVSYFLWHVCVRSLGMDAVYKYPGLISKFYSRTKSVSLSHASVEAEKFIDLKLLPLFQARASGLNSWAMPSIYGKNSSLVSRLYHFPARDDA